MWSGHGGEILVEALKTHAVDHASAFEAHDLTRPGGRVVPADSL